MVDLEDKFIDLAFGVSEMKRLTREDVRAYIRYIADRRLMGLGLKGIFKSTTNPLPWVDAMLGVTHTNLGGSLRGTSACCSSIYFRVCVTIGHIIMATL